MYVINKSALVSPPQSYNKSNLYKKCNQRNLHQTNRQYYSKRSISEHCSRNQSSDHVLRKRNSSKTTELEQLNEIRRRKSNQFSNNPIKQNRYGDVINNDENKLKKLKSNENFPNLIKKYDSSSIDNNHENDQDSDQNKSEINNEIKENSLFIPKEILCNYCDRFYSKASIEIHERKCNLMYQRRTKKLEAEKLWKEKLLRKPSHPPGQICYICGGRFTNASWCIHQKNCLKQWSIWNSLLPKQKQHKILPQLPKPTENEIQNRIELAHYNGNLDYERLDALDDIMLEEAKKNQLPLELIC